MFQKANRHASLQRVARLNKGTSSQVLVHRFQDSFDRHPSLLAWPVFDIILHNSATRTDAPEDLADSVHTRLN